MDYLMTQTGIMVVVLILILIVLPLITGEKKDDK
jgi:hypothetical protein